MWAGYSKPVVRVAVKLPGEITNVGEYLSDVTALEAAGADTIWIDDTALEPWVVLGAMAAVTHRVGLGCLLNSIDDWSPDRVGASASALQVLSRGRVVVGLPARGIPAGHLAALRAAGTKILTTGSQQGLVDGVIIDVQSADDLPDAPGTVVEVWAAVAVPPDREAWSRALSTYEAAGATGVIVPWNSRVVDLLRNPEPDDRTDLLISTG